MIFCKRFIDSQTARIEVVHAGPRVADDAARKHCESTSRAVAPHAASG